MQQQIPIPQWSGMWVKSVLGLPICLQYYHLANGLFVCCCFTSQVNSYGHGMTVSSPNHTFSWASFNKQLTIFFAHTFACNWQQPFLNDSAERRRMTIEIISWSISTKVWDRVGIKLATPGSAFRLTSVARHVTDCANGHTESNQICLVTYLHMWVSRSITVFCFLDPPCMGPSECAFSGFAVSFWIAG